MTKLPKPDRLRELLERAAENPDELTLEERDEINDAFFAFSAAFRELGASLAEVLAPLIESVVAVAEALAPLFPRVDHPIPPLPHPPINLNPHGRSLPNPEGTNK